MSAPSMRIKLFHILQKINMIYNIQFFHLRRIYGGVSAF